MTAVGQLTKTCFAGALTCVAGVAIALPPDQIFERVAPSVWSVKTYTAEEQLIASASGVVVAPGKVVTSCQVLTRARQVQLRRGNTIYDAKLEFPDVERDLCQLDVPGLAAPAPAPGTASSLRTGQRLYVVGFARGNDQSLGEGLVSAVTDSGTGKARIQTTVPAAAGLRGAGLFDEEARLVGIVTFSPPDAPATAFAVPADWVAEVAARGQAALAAHRKASAAATAGATAGAAATGMPTPGTEWKYTFSDRVFRRRQGEYTVRALRIDGKLVEEVVSAPGGADVRRVISGADAHIVEYALSGSVSALEFAPYLLATSAGKPPVDAGSPSGYPIGSPGLPGWITTATVQGWEQVAVPAGSYKALRIDLTGRRNAPMGGRSSAAGRFSISAWYAQDVKRLVRLEHRMWTADAYASALASDEVVELVSYRPTP